MITIPENQYQSAWYDTLAGAREKRVDILGPAILFRGNVFTAPKPKRHLDVRQAMRKVCPEYVMGLGETMGFYTSTNEFVNRIEALKIARICGLLLPGVTPSFAMGLFTEDLW